MGRKMRLMLLAGLTAGIALAFSQEDSDQDARRVIHTRKASHYYEVLTKESLSKYYDERTFLVDAKVVLSDAAADLQFGEIGEIKALPGLPILPDELRSGGSAGTGGETEERPSFSIKFIDLELLLDTSYNEKDIEFIQNLVSMAANLNEFRGDKLKIKKGIFPVKKSMSSLGMVAQRVDAPTLSDSGRSSAVGYSNPFKPFVDNLASLIPLLVICLFILLIVWIVMRTLSHQQNRKANNSESLTAILSEISQLKNSFSGAAAPKEDNDAERAEFGELRSYLLSSFIGKTKTSTDVISSWINENIDQGTQEAARLIKAVDERLMKIISPELMQHVQKGLEDGLKQIGAVSAQEANPILRKFKSDFERRSSFTVNNDEYKDMFGFLKQLNEQQILHMIKEESEGIIGILLAQLDADKAGKILQKLDKSKRSKILASMGKIENIPLTAYKDLADRLSTQALEVIKMRYVTSDGVHSVLEVLDNLPLNLQDDYMSALAETDIHLAEKIRSIFITMSELPGLPDKFLSPIVRSLDQEALVLVMVGAEDGLKNKIFQLLPERMQQMVRSGMESRADAPSEALEGAQRKLLQRVRQEIKNAGGRPA